MSPWEILGIPSTVNIGEIKKAFAQKAKNCHPEEDPEGFVRLREAFRFAMDRAEGRTTGHWTEQKSGGEEGEDAPPLKKEKPASAVLQNTTFAGQAATEVPFAQASQTIDFSGVEEAAESLAAENRKKADALLSQIAAIYTGRNKNKPAAWTGLFSGEDFLHLRDNRYFTLHFCDYLMTHREFTHRVWNIAFVPVVTEWQHHWYGSNLAAYFALACGLEEQGKPSAPPVSVRPKKLLTGALLVCCCLVAFLVLPFRNGETRQKQERQEREKQAELMRQIQETQGQLPSIEAPDNAILKNMETLVMQGQLPAGHTLAEYLPLAAEDYKALEAENQLRKTLLQAVQQGAAFAEVGAEAGQLGLSEDEYNELNNEYGAQQNSKLLEDSLSHYAPVENQMVQEKILPLIQADILAEAPAENSKYLRLSIGMEAEDYEKTAARFTEGGQAAVSSDLSAYTRFAHSAETMQTAKGLPVTESASQ